MLIGGIMSTVTGTGFSSGAVGAGVNEALINEIKDLDPGTAQIVSAIIGAAAAKTIGDNATAGATATASGTKNNAVAALAIEPLISLVAMLGYVILTDENGKRSIAEMIEGVPETLATLTDAGLEWLDDMGEPIENIIDYVYSARASDKEKANDTPSWAKGMRPAPGESGKDFAKRVMDERYGKDNYRKGPGSEYNRLRKWGDRGEKNE